MNKTENYKKIIGLLRNLKDINMNKLTSVQKYSKSHRVYNDFSVRLKNIGLISDTQLNDIEYLQKIIKDKIEAIDQLIKKAGDIE